VPLRSDSAAGVRFLASVREGRGVKPSARAAGVGKETGYRWLREAFLLLRERGVSAIDAQAELGHVTPLALVWEQSHAGSAGSDRHHLAHSVGPSSRRSGLGTWVGATSARRVAPQVGFVTGGSCGTPHHLHLG